MITLYDFASVGSGCVDGGSWEIANSLEMTFSDSPSLFGGAAREAFTRFVEAWVANVLHRGIQGLNIFGSHGQVDAAERA